MLPTGRGVEAWSRSLLGEASPSAQLAAEQQLEEVSKDEALSSPVLSLGFLLYSQMDYLGFLACSLFVLSLAPQRFFMAGLPLLLFFSLFHIIFIVYTITNVPIFCSFAHPPFPPFGA